MARASVRLVEPPAPANFVPPALFNFARDLFGRIATAGWRPLFAWCGVLLALGIAKFAYIVAPSQNIALSGEYYLGANAFIALIVATFVTRGIEKADERRNGAINPHGGPPPV